GDIWQIKNGLNKDICVVEVIRVDVILFGDIDETFAIYEGDGTLANWYDIHFNYYSKLLSSYELLLTNETELECVWFKRINNKRYKR
ncbi:MAG: ASCH domain-containing protein, partial [Vagococcus sp.]|nr:ASCH domain-containing protein [Vagococcus sp.]